ncbi:MAG: N(G),N(G)-dimethylarginine dimethylaminohydrolase [Thermoanaerobaculia bacterium]
MFRRALVRPPGQNFADGLTTVDLGVPDFEATLVQHAAYCRALEGLGLALTRLPADLAHPDATFVEDAAVLTPRGAAILTRPGAPSREGEVAAIAKALSPFYPSFSRIEAPGTLDGGDICEAGNHYFLGVSARTNEEGARQLARLLAAGGYTSSVVDIRGVPGILHLKSGVAWLGGRRLAVIGALAGVPAFRGWELLRLSPEEDYAANLVLVNDAVLVAEGFPKLAGAVRDLGHRTVSLAMSEFRKMDGGLSCLSLRF